LRTWGPYLAIDFKLENHWFISHAIPMFVFSMVESVIAISSFLLVGLMFREPAPDSRSERVAGALESAASP